MKETTVSPCAQWATKLAARHAHDLTPAERIELNQHLSTCVACASIARAYSAMELHIRSLPTIAPLANLPQEVVEGDRQTISAEFVFSPKSRIRGNALRAVPRQQSVRSKRGMLSHSLEMGFALACVACIILVSLALFQRAHTSTGALSPQDIYHQAISGRPVLDDHMTGLNVNTMWDQWARCQYIGRVYHVMAPEQQNATACLAQASNFSNFALQVNMTILKGDGGGVLFRSKSDYSLLYKFTIGTDGTYTLLSPYKKTCKTLATGYSTAIRTGLSQSNVLTVIARGSSLYVYINGQFVAQAQDGTALSGAIGLYAFNLTQNTDVEFSDVKVWQLR